MTRGTSTWKEFQDLVALMEQTLVAEGGIVTSPDRIKQPITGQIREVDATIRSRVGSADILILVECRKRRKIDDVTWIEQLAQKRINLQADKIIAVSNAGFTSNAIRTAAHNSVELRLMRNIDEEEIKTWTTKASALYFERSWKIIGFDAKDTMGNELVATKDFLDLCSRDKINTVMIYSGKSHSYSIYAIATSLIESAGFPPDKLFTKEILPLKLIATMIPDRWMTKMTGQETILSELSLTIAFRLRHVVTPVETYKAVEYSSLQRTIMRYKGVSFESPDGFKIQIEYMSEPPDLDEDRS